MVEAEMADAAGAAAVAPAAFDLESYIAPYAAPAKLDRLLWIADQCAGLPLELEALKMAGDDVKKVRMRRVGGLCLFGRARPALARSLAVAPLSHARSLSLSLSLSLSQTTHDRPSRTRTT